MARKRKVQLKSKRKAPQSLTKSVSLDKGSLSQNDTRAFTFGRGEIKKNEVIEQKVTFSRRHSHLWSYFWSIIPHRFFFIFVGFLTLLIVPTILLIIYFI